MGVWLGSRFQGLLELTAVGDETEIGKVAMAVATVESGEQTPLNVQLERLSQLIGVVGLSFWGECFQNGAFVSK